MSTGRNQHTAGDRGRQAGGDALLNLASSLGQHLTVTASIGGCLLSDRCGHEPYSRRWTVFVLSRFEWVRQHQTGPFIDFTSADRVVYIAAEGLCSGMPHRFRTRRPSDPGDALLVTDVSYLDHLRDVAAANGITSSDTFDLDTAGQEAILDKLEDVFPDTTRGYSTIPANAVCLTITSFAKRGQCTPAWLRKRTAAISSETGFEVDLDRESMKRFWDRFGSKIAKPETWWESFFESLATGLDPGQVRMRVCIAQAKFAGMSAATLIAKAVNDFGDFPWRKFFEYVPESAAVCSIVNEARGHPYLVFALAPGAVNPVRSTRVSNSLHLALQLLTKVGGEGSIPQYMRGFAGGQTVKYKALIDDWVAKYSAERLESFVYPTYEDPSERPAAFDLGGLLE